MLLDVFMELSLTFKQIVNSLKLLSEQPEPKPAFPIDKSLVEDVCNMVLLSELKARYSQKVIKNIFTDISSLGEGHNIIETFFKNSLSSALEGFVHII